MNNQAPISKPERTPEYQAGASERRLGNSLAGPGELPPEDETDAQAYFDREIKPVDEALQEIMWARLAEAVPAPAAIAQQGREVGS